jgi:hypothetical protein
LTSARRNAKANNETVYELSTEMRKAKYPPLHADLNKTRSGDSCAAPGIVHPPFRRYHDEVSVAAAAAATRPAQVSLQTGRGSEHKALSDPYPQIKSGFFSGRFVKN